MTRSIHTLLAAAGLLLASCTTITVEPQPLSLPALPAAARPALDFVLHTTKDPYLGLDFEGPRYASESRVDGEDLARATATIRAALEATAAFASVTRGGAGQRLHCDLRVRFRPADGSGAMIIFMSAGVLPFATDSHHELVATVTAPGRAPQDYTFRCETYTFAWVPLLPVAIVQGLFQSSPLQQIIDALVAQMAHDGWLGASQ
jgi:hypothetical protein